MLVRGRPREGGPRHPVARAAAVLRWVSFLRRLLLGALAASPDPPLRVALIPLLPGPPCRPSGLHRVESLLVALSF